MAAVAGRHRSRRFGSVRVREEERHVVCVRTAGSGTLQGIGPVMSAQYAPVVAARTQVVPAGADEGSAQMAAQFTAYAHLLPAVSGQAAAIREMFLNTLGTSARSYVATDPPTRLRPADSSG